MRSKYRALPRFTLVARLVAIAIIGVLVGILLPAVQAAREITWCRIDLACSIIQHG